MELKTSGATMGLGPPEEYFTDRSGTVLHLWGSLCVFSVLHLLCLCARLLCVPCGRLLGRADLLALVCGV